jgi:hypothetical protein
MIETHWRKFTAADLEAEPALVKMLELAMPRQVPWPFGTPVDGRVLWVFNEDTVTYWWQAEEP